MELRNPGTNKDCKTALPLFVPQSLRHPLTPYPFTFRIRSSKTRPTPPGGDLDTPLFLTLLRSSYLHLSPSPPTSAALYLLRSSVISHSSSVNGLLQKKVPGSKSAHHRGPRSGRPIVRGERRPDFQRKCSEQSGTIKNPFNELCSVAEAYCGMFL